MTASLRGGWRKVAAPAAAALLALGAASAQARPAALDGLWCGTGLLHEFRLRLAQQDHALSGTLQRKERIRAVQGRVDGTIVRTEAVRYGSLVLELAGDELRITGGEGPLALAQGQAFARAPDGRCSRERSAGIADRADGHR